MTKWCAGLSITAIRDWANITMPPARIAAGTGCTWVYLLLISCADFTSAAVADLIRVFLRSWQRGMLAIFTPLGPGNPWH